MKLLEVERNALCDYAVNDLGPALSTDVVFAAWKPEIR